MRVLSYLAYDLDSGLLLVLENSKAPETSKLSSVEWGAGT